MTTQDKKFEEQEVALSRRGFLGLLGKGAVCAGALVGAGSAVALSETQCSKHAFQQNDEQYAEAVNNPPKIPDYKWNDHQWAMGVDTTRCIGCLRCMEACKMERVVSTPIAH